MSKRLLPLRNGTLTNMGTVLGKVAAPAIEESSRPIVPVRLAWHQLCGSALSGHTEPLKLEHETLFVSADGEEWAEAINEIRYELLDSLRRAFPHIHALAVVVNPGPRRPAPTPRPQRSPKPNPDHVGIQHPGLRAACDGLAALRDDAQAKPTKKDD